jgi:prevent-host-death family protein
MKQVGIFEAKTRFSAVIEDARAGKTTIVTKNGKPVAEIGPVRTDQRARGKLAAQRLRALRATLRAEGKLRGIEIRKLIYEERK